MELRYTSINNLLIKLFLSHFLIIFAPKFFAATSPPNETPDTRPLLSVNLNLQLCAVFHV